MAATELLEGDVRSGVLLLTEATLTEIPQHKEHAAREQEFAM